MKKVIVTCDEKDEDVPGEGIPAKNFPLNELPEIFHDIENAENRILEANPNLERSITVHQGI